jgi:hypothetical protein
LRGLLISLSAFPVPLLPKPRSPLSNLKELRIQHRGQPYRAFFVFDPQRQAIVLCAGNKQGDKRFYERMTPLAESIYQRYLQEKKQ